MRGWPTWNPTAVKETDGMSLTRAEKERLRDSRLKLRSVAESLQHVDPKKVPQFEEIEECLEDAERSLRGALGGGDPELVN